MSRYPSSWRATLIWCGALYALAALAIYLKP